MTFHTCAACSMLGRVTTYWRSDLGTTPSTARSPGRSYPIRKVTTPVPGEGGAEGGGLRRGAGASLMAAGSRTDWRATAAPWRGSRTKRSTRSGRCRRSRYSRSSSRRPPAPASTGGSPPSCSSAPAAANAPGSLMLFHVVSIQPSERWTSEMRNSSMWPLKGSAMPLTCRPMPRAAESRSMGWVSLICATRVPRHDRSGERKPGATGA